MNRVAIIKTVPEYPLPPFSPDTKYAEYNFEDISKTNYVYKSVRDLFCLLELDKENIGSKEWNPLGSVITRNDTVLIKPNVVGSFHFNNGELTSLITHASVVRPIIDYALIALNGTGNIIIADSPERVADFNVILQKSGISDLLSYYNKNGIHIEVRDLRREKIKYGYGAISQKKRLPGDIEGYQIIDLGKDSEFSSLSPNKLSRLYGADYNRRETLKHHNEFKHEYEVSNTLLKSDVVISVPKLKTHRKAGVTLNLKGLVGCTGNKNFIPHRTLGDRSNGGDSYPYPAVTRRGNFIRKLDDLLKDYLLGFIENKYSAILYTLIKQGFVEILHVPKNDLPYGGGAWDGNDTLWRSVVDITRIIHYADKNGCLCDKKQRKFFGIIDGIHAGDKNGPMEPMLRKEGVLIAGSDLLAADIASTITMGFDYNRIIYLKRLLNPHKYDLSINLGETKVISNHKKFENILSLKREESLQFEEAEYWNLKIPFR
jgi:uncharacterized protein (DUF362 family)